LLCALGATVATTSAGARPVATPGVTGTEIHLGSSVPLSGEASIAGNVARGADAYFQYVNDTGGVFGRKIKFTYLDDGYDPGRAVNNTIRLIQQEQVLAVFSSLGTSNNLAVRKLLNDAKVPQLYVASGATTFGRDYKKYPWTLGYIPPYSEEGELYGRYVVKNIKKPQISVNDVSSASALMAIVPQSAANGAISIVFGKDPAAPLWRNDKGIKLFQSILRKYGSSVNSRDLQDGYFTTGMATAYTMVDTLKKAGRNPTRQSVMNAAIHLNEKGNPFVLPGIVLHTTPSSRFPLTQVRLQRWSANAWHPFGKLITARPG